MNKRCKVSINCITAWSVFVFMLFTTLAVQAQVRPAAPVKPPASVIDSGKISLDSARFKIAGDSVKLITDSVRFTIDSLTGDTLWQRIDSIPMSKDTLDAPVDYTAEDSAIISIPKKQFFLYNKAVVKYQDNQLEANVIHYDQQSQVMEAYGGKDTSSNPLNLPTMTQGQSKAISDTIKYNVKTGRGLTKNSYFQEGEMYVQAQTLKRMDKDVAFAFRARMTTCNLDTPHFAFRTRRVKIINDRFAVSGPAFPEFEGVPMPVAIPFGIYPMVKGRHSGMLAPQFATNQSAGLGLEGLGYYKVINDNWDVTTRANLYTYGGWALFVNPKYMKRYKYSGNLNLTIQKTKLVNTSTAQSNEFIKYTSFLINWSHSTDTRARPGTSFSASVNAGSTRYNDYVTNNIYQNFQNQLSSSITYSKTWGQGKYNLTTSANHSQNNNQRLVNVTLPTVNFTANTFYPFQKKESVGTAKWYEKLGISYTGNLLNQVAFYDTAFNFARMLDTTQWGAQHSVPISLTLPAVGPLLFSPSISFSEKWYGQQILRRWNPDRDTVETRISRGFFAAREVNFGMSTNTRIFGTFNLGKDTKLRHEIKPTFSINYKPDLVKQFYDSLQVDTSTARKKIRISRFEGSVVGGFSEGSFGGFNFGFDNLFEMKKRNKNDTTGDDPYKKIKLIDGLSFNTGYNFFLDSMNWSPVSIAFRSTLFEKVNITGGASIDPYAVDSVGDRINKLLWKQGSLGRFTGGNLVISSSFQSKAADQRSDKSRMPVDQTMTPDEQQRQLDYVRANPAEFVDFNIPWSVQTSLSINFNRQRSADYRSYVTQINTNLNVSGDFSLTPKWKMGGSFFYDVRTAKLEGVTMYITREMHCWQLSINVTPIGPIKSFNIVLNPKSGILRDLKINRSRSFYSAIEQ
ncbi:putative LPS assembly protein LptD [Filimonas effusa]|uniref:LPS-assembly protein LptD n=1 Tax=Filimonas effusa TaxID=2508721 RepID=A0A4Q1DAH0_9BACT|nr:putative LPS assembly protein LptD [Filimonas effusa]RXK86404.1 LPS-assembly protein LptD [Filimonas effusa]